MPDQKLEAELKPLFGKPPKAVVEFFEKKTVHGPNFHWNWSDTLRHAHDRVFVVSKATSADLVADIKKALQESIANGMPYQDFANNIIPTLKDKGWWGGEKHVEAEAWVDDGTGKKVKKKLEADVVLNHRRLRQIYDTNMKTAYAAGRYAKMMEHAEEMPYWRYVARPPGPTRREDHQALHNMVFRYDDPIWATHYPPNGWGCQCRVERLDKKALERKYKRPADEVVQASAEDDYQTENVQMQGKQETRTGFKVGKTTVFTDKGWDYAPGEYSYRSKRLLENKIMALPPGEPRDKLRTQLEESFKKDFELFTKVETKLKQPVHEDIAVGLLDEDVAKALDGKTYRTKSGEQKTVKLESTILTTQNWNLSHAVRSSKDHKGLAMPSEQLGRLPSLLQEYTPVFENGAMVYYSAPFKESGTPFRWRLVFELKKPSFERYVFKTATKVDASAFKQAAVAKK